jgi:hypothetical protein
MNVKLSIWLLAITSGLILLARVSFAQNASTQVFSAVDLRDSIPSASYTTPDLFSTSTINLFCGASPYAQLSGPLMNSAGTVPVMNGNSLVPGGNLIVDNNLLVTVTPLNQSPGTTTNVCTGGYYQGGAPGPTSPTDTNQNCFNLNGYGSPATAGFNPSLPLPNPGPLDGDDPDTYVAPGTGQTIAAGGGVAPIDISSLLAPGVSNTALQQQAVTFALADYGGGYFLTSSSIFLTTNCTIGAVTGPATVSGNTITTGTNTNSAQTFTFNAGSGDTVGFVYDVSAATSTLTSDSQTVSTPQTGDLSVAATLFQSDFVPRTSFATSNCLIHTGEVLADGVTPACKLYTLKCTTPYDSTPAGALCPASEIENEVVKDLFDGPPFSLQSISTPFGVVNEGIGFLMASDEWPNTPAPPASGNCTFDPASNLQTLPCPQNLLVSFSGPGGFAGQGLTRNPNSTFISVYGVPEDHTSVLIAGAWPGNWVNTSTPKVYFLTQAPNFTRGASVLVNGRLKPLPSAGSYIPAPIASLTYGITTAANLPLPINEPIMADSVLYTKAPCTSPLPTTTTEPNFAPGPVTLASLPDGQYLLHYYAQDCAGTQELQFTEAPTSGIWSTNFYTYPVNIDTTAPGIVNDGISGTPKVGGPAAYATFTCTDSEPGSGVVLCGSNRFATQSTYNTGKLKIQLNTSSVGSKSLTVYAQDGAGNTSSIVIPYTVAPR